ncbi:hypothetical protein BGZ63DRAFT_51961 [Mariannaea sp. PMI_226]|nr:hypothetical protein BGZ63DRAFT_51961 [Mariannaea sp. PMI_226]
MEQPPQHAAYGTACTNCARSKCRCVIPNPGDACERCRRLGKVCVQSGTKRKREVTKTSTSRNEQLEAKIDGLVSLLKSSTGSPAAVETQRVNGLIPVSFRSPAVETHRSCVMSTAASLQSLDEAPPMNEQEILHEFMALRLIHLPFIHIPSHTSAADMRATKPFLWLCIRAISTRSTLQQTKLYSQIRTILGQSMVSELERSTEQLLGLLVCIAWGNLQVHQRPFLTLFTQLSISIVFDLGLNVKPPTGPDEKANYRFHKPWISGRRTMEERRAVLGLYFLSSVVSCNLDRIDTLRWTPHMAECVNQLQQSEECESDLLLAALVKIQKLVDKIRQFRLHEREAGRAVSLRPPALFYAKALQTELDDAKRQLRPDLQSNRVLLNYYYHAQLKIYEFVLFDEFPTSPSNFDRLETLYICLSAIKNYFDVFLTYAQAEYVGFSTSSFFQLTHCMMCLYRLSATEDPSWDRMEVVKTLDVIVIGRRIAQNFRDAATAAGLIADGQPDHLTRLASVVESATTHWESKLRAQAVSQGLPAGDQNINSGEMSQAEEYVPELTDEFWLSDLLVPMEWQENVYS